MITLTRALTYSSLQLRYTQFTYRLSLFLQILLGISSTFLHVQPKVNIVVCLFFQMMRVPQEMIIEFDSSEVILL